MKRLQTSLMGMTVLAAVTLTNAVACAENLIVNGSFEQIDPSRQGAWLHWDVKQSGTASLVPSGEHYQGATSAMLVADGGTRRLSQRIANVPPAFRLTAFVSGNDAAMADANDASIELQIRFQSGPPAVSRVALPVGTYDWKRLELTGAVDPNKSIESVVVTVGGRLKSGRVLIDQMVLGAARDESPAGLLRGKVDDLLTQLDRVGDVDDSVGQARGRLQSARAVIPADMTAANAGWVNGASVVSRKAWAAMFPDALGTTSADAHMIFHGHGATKEECDQHLRLLEKSHANAAYLSLGSWMSAAYWSNVLPRLPEYSSFDSLRYFIDEAHRRNIKVYGYIALLYGAKDLPSGPGTLVARHPDWFARPGPDAAMPSFPDPSHPAVVAYLGDAYVDLVKHYAIDGIGLDYLRYPTPTCFNFDDRTQRAMQQRFGFDIRQGDPLAEPARADRLHQYRSEAVAGLAEAIRKRVKAERPGITVNACLLSDPVEAERYGQSWKPILPLVDYATPMNYGDSSADDGLLRTQANACAAGDAVFIPAIGGMPDVHQSWTISTWAARIAQARKAGGHGVVIYRVGDLDLAVAAFLGSGPFASDAEFPKPEQK